MFCNLCGIYTTLNRNQRPEALGTIKPLESGEPYETHESGGKTIQVWHPNWLGQVDENVNAKFIKEVAECVYNDEKVSIMKNSHELFPINSTALPCKCSRNGGDPRSGLQYAGHYAMCEGLFSQYPQASDQS
jgi:hypothetical protein